MSNPTGASALQSALQQICNGVAVESRGMFVPDSIEFDQAERIGGLLFDLEEVNRFAIGDFLNHCERVFQEAWAQLLSEKLAKRMSTIENWRYTCRNVALSVRRDDLTMAAHYAVASLKSQLLQEQLLRLGAEEQLPSDDIAKLASLFRDMETGDQFTWGEQIWQNEFTVAEVLQAYEKTLPQKAETQPDQPAQPTQPGTLSERLIQPLTSSQTGDEDCSVPFNLREPAERQEVQYSGESRDYNWSEKDDYDQEEEEPGDLVALKVALEEMYLAPTAQEYKARRDTLHRLLGDLDLERAELYAAVGSEEEPDYA